MLLEGGRSALQELAFDLLPATVQHAKRAPFWADRLSDTASADDFISIPVVTRSEIRAAGRRAQVCDRGGWNDYFTGGTSGEPFSYRVNDSEQNYLDHFFSGLNESWAGPKPRAAGFVDLVHGGSRRVPTPMRLHPFSLHSCGAPQLIRELLTTEFEEDGVEPRVRVLFGGERALRAFTADTAQRYPLGLPGIQIDHLLIYGTYLTPAVRSRLENYWGAVVVDRFGLSEIIGGATQDLASGWYHFDPCLYAEALGKTADIEPRSGIGRLVLTPLYPFQQAQPLIRYDTGDLVEFTREHPSAPGELLIRPLGRAKQGVAAPDADDWIVLPGPMHHVVDSCPGVARVPWFVGANHLARSDDLGYPRYRLRCAAFAKTVSIRVDVALDSRTQGARERRALDGLRQSIAQLLRTDATGHRVELLVARNDEVVPSYGTPAD